MAVTSDEKLNMQRTWMGLLSVLVLGGLGNTTATLWAAEPALNLIRPDPVSYTHLTLPTKA